MRGLGGPVQARHWCRSPSRPALVRPRAQSRRMIRRSLALCLRGRLAVFVAGVGVVVVVVVVVVLVVVGCAAVVVAVVVFVACVWSLLQVLRALVQVRALVRSVLVATSYCVGVGVSFVGV